jgi:hypothetical protein
MSPFGKVALVLPVLTLVVGLPVGMPMASCPSACCRPGPGCLLVASLTQQTAGQTAPARQQGLDGLPQLDD